MTGSHAWHLQMLRSFISQIYQFYSYLRIKMSRKNHDICPGNYIVLLLAILPVSVRALSVGAIFHRRACTLIDFSILAVKLYCRACRCVNPGLFGLESGSIDR